MVKKRFLFLFICIFLLIFNLSGGFAQKLDYSDDKVTFFEKIFWKITGKISNYCPDLDNDGWSSDANCNSPRIADCDETYTSVNPGATEIPYNGRDDDCNPSTRDDDLDVDGYLKSNDCNDNDYSINPGASEICGDWIDNDCDNQIDENLKIYHKDLDGDNYGVSSIFSAGCTSPGSTWILSSSSLGEDCDDFSSSINPGAIEILNNGKDDDCDGIIDESIKLYYKDADADGYSNISLSTESFNSPGSTWILSSSSLGEDCDDEKANVHPGIVEIYGDGLDNDCNILTLDNDFDFDGYNVTEDCNDTNLNVNPGAPEICGDSLDNNCNQVIDEGCSVNWNEFKFACNANDTRIVQKVDLSGIEESFNYTDFCDYGSLGFIGEDLIDLNISVNGTNFKKSYNYTSFGFGKINLSKEYGGVTFDWDFYTNPLNVYDVEVNSLDDKDYGYVYVKGLNVQNKSLYFMKKNNKSDMVCIKDSEMNSVDDFSNNCSGKDEFLVSCPGKNGKYNCEISSTGDSFLVWPLNHSGAREYFEISYICKEEWVCEDWEGVSCVNDVKKRNCFDKNNCNTTYLKPLVAKNCVVSLEDQNHCNSNWQCTSWSDCEDGKETRICKDINDCEFSVDVPEESRSCAVKETIGEKKNLWFLVLVFGGFSFLVLIILFFILRGHLNKLSKKNKSFSKSSSSQTYK